MEATVIGNVIQETADAVLFESFETDKTAWVPVSQILARQDGEIVVPEWLAIDKELV